MLTNPLTFVYVAGNQMRTLNQQMKSSCAGPNIYVLPVFAPFSSIK